MNFRNKYLLTTLRVLTGLFFIMSGVGGLLAMQSPTLEGIPPQMVPMTQALIATGIFHMIKITEIVAGLMLVTGFLPALAAIFLAPICIGVLVFHARTSPESLPVGIIVTVLNVYFGYAYWDKYKQLFVRK